MQNTPGGGPNVSVVALSFRVVEGIGGGFQLSKPGPGLWDRLPDLRIFRTGGALRSRRTGVPVSVTSMPAQNWESESQHLP